MDNSIKQQAQDQIAQARHILMVVSQKSAFDGIASGLSLYLSLKKLNKSVSINATQPTVGDAKLLYAIDKIGKSEDKKNLVITIDNAVKNVDKVTYFLDGDKLKIIVHSFSESEGISPSEISFDNTPVKPDLVFALGQASFEELKNEITREQQIDPNTFIINISKTESIKKFAQINICDPTATSISELMANFFQTLALPLDEDISFNLYSGLSAATQMFSPSLVKASTLQTASWLLKFGAGNASFAINDNQSAPLYEPSIDISIDKDEIGREQKKIIPPTQFPEISQTPIEQVEVEKSTQKDWLKPPKIYRGSKSFDIES